VKHGTVFVFAIVTILNFSWATFGGVPLETQVERLYYLVLVNVVFVFATDWYRAKAFEDRIRKLERALAERDMSA
jgi:hypothetical protein